MKKLLIAFLLLPLLSFGQGLKFSNLPYAPLVNSTTTLVGLNTSGGSSVAYQFTIGQLATYIGAATTISGTPYAVSFFNGAGLLAKSNILDSTLIHKVVIKDTAYFTAVPTSAGGAVIFTAACAFRQFLGREWKGQGVHAPSPKRLG